MALTSGNTSDRVERLKPRRHIMQIRAARHHIPLMQSFCNEYRTLFKMRSRSPNHHSYMIITITSVVSKTSNAAAAGVELLRPLSRHSVHRSVKRLTPEL